MVRLAPIFIAFFALYISVIFMVPAEARWEVAMLILGAMATLAIVVASIAGAIILVVWTISHIG